GSFAEIQQQIADLLSKLDKLPIAEIGTNLRDTLQGTNALMKQLDTQLAPQAREMLASAQKAMDAASATLSGDAPLGRGTARTLEQLQRAAQSLRNLADYLQRHPQALLYGKPADPPLPPSGDQ
ncbi:MAG TPA: mammalian cell entry protein, partial [Rudaea sp.]|nr:mammalian cell entry protein [Rudaea sp.]